MTDYIYTREIVNGRWDIDNQYDVDGEGEPIHLANEVEAALPGTVFKLVCNGSEAKFIFTEALSAPDETTLDNCVATHKAYSA